MWVRHLAWVLVCACALAGSARGAIIGIDFRFPGDAVNPTPTNWTPIDVAGSFTNLKDESGAVTGVGVNVTNPGSPFTTFFTPINPSSIPAHTPMLGALDDYANGVFLTVEFVNLVPNAEYHYWIFGLRASAYRQTVTVTGATTTSVIQAGIAGDLTVNHFAPTTAALGTLALTIHASSAGKITFANDPGVTAPVTGRYAGFAIERVTAVPEPASILAWVVLVAAGALFVSRRQRVQPR